MYSNLVEGRMTMASGETALIVGVGTKLSASVATDALNFVPTPTIKAVSPLAIVILPSTRFEYIYLKSK